VPTTMALRFRDLVGPTIAEHREILARDRHAWWGWWSKPDESIPRRTFALFTETISSHGVLQIFLADSGSRKLYEAELTRIEPSASDDPIPCPEPNLTPTYYNKSQYKAWFEFTGEIKEIDPKVLESWSYDEVDASEFIDDSTSAQFDKKRVVDIEELLNRRHRTIYFLKPFDVDLDRTIRVELVPAIGPVRIAPQGDGTVYVSPVVLRPFTTSPIIVRSSTVLHVSDLHFDGEHHRFPRQPNRHGQSLFQLIDDDFTKSKIEAPGVLLVTGDLTWRGLEAEFEHAAEFIDKLCSVFGLGREHLIIVPGNHDIAWAGGGKGDYDPKSPVADPPERAEAAYRAFFNGVVGFPPNDYLSLGRRYVLGNYTAVDFIGLNSCRLEQEHFAGFGFVSSPQLTNAVESMRWRSGDYPVHVRVLAMHHHVAPVSAVEAVESYDTRYSLTLDAGTIVEEALGVNVDLIVHGHMHQPFVTSVARRIGTGQEARVRSLAIHGAGSAGVKPRWLGHVGQNCYTILRLDTSGGDILVRSNGAPQAGFSEYAHYRVGIGPSGCTIDG